MTRLRHTLCTIVLILVASVVAAAGPDLPFHASIDTQPQVLGPCGPGCLALEIPGSGTATLLGKVTIAGPSRVNLINGTQTATSTLTAANGDQLVLDIAGTAQFTGPNPDDPVTFTGEWTVQSGTGRFQAASGSGTYSGSSAGPSGEFTLTGTISNIGKR
jgi:hypothetical protein